MTIGLSNIMVVEWWSVVDEWWVQRELSTFRERVRIVLAGGMATLAACLLVWLIRRTLEGTRRAMRGVRRTLQESPHRSVIPALIALGASAVVTAKSLWVSTPVEMAAHADREDEPQRDANSADPLPALASAGLAVGLRAHVQRRRREVLDRAPLATRLVPPRGVALATGTAVFERAAAWQPPTTEDVVVLPLGIAGGDLVSLSLRGGDIVAVDAHVDDSLGVLRHIANTLALAPWLGHRQLIVLGMNEQDLVVANLAQGGWGHGCVVTIVESEEALRSQVRRVRTAEPGCSVMVITSIPITCTTELTDDGVVVIGTAASGSCDQTPNLVRIVREPHNWRISPNNATFQPYGVSRNEAASFRSMVGELTALESRALPTQRVDDGDTQAGGCVVAMLGAVRVHTLEGDEIRFRKAKSVELLCWLLMHPDRPTVSAARTALWEVNVEDSTFHNVLSELRRGFAEFGDRNLVRRIGKHRLSVSGDVLSDVHILERVLHETNERCDTDALQNLREVLESVDGLPFAGNDYSWADAEGITSMIVWLVTKAVDQAYGIARSVQDEAAMLEVARAGLRMLPGDEHFRALCTAAVGNRGDDVRSVDVLAASQ